MERMPPCGRLVPIDPVVSMVLHSLTLPPFTAPREAAKTFRTFIRRDHVQLGSVRAHLLAPLA